MPALTMFEVTPDHPVPISPQGGTATITVLSGDTLYYADTPQVSAAHNQGSVTAGNVQSFTNPAWVRSASLSTVLAQVTAALPAGVADTSIDVTSPIVAPASPRNRALRDFVSVLDYGTYTSGDMTSTWASALAAASAKGTANGAKFKLYAPPNTYQLTSLLPQSYVDIHAHGAVLTRPASYVADRSFFFQTTGSGVGSPVTRLTLRGFVVPGTGTETANQGLIRVGKSTHIVVEDCEMTGSRSFLVMVEDCQYCWVDRNTILGNPSLGNNTINFVSGPDGNTVPLKHIWARGNLIEDHTSLGIAIVGTDVGTRTDPDVDGHIEGNTCIGTGAGWPIGVEQGGSVAPNMKNIDITGNTCVQNGTGQYAIVLTNDSTPPSNDPLVISGVTIRGNRLSSLQAGGIGLLCVASRVSIQGNYIEAAVDDIKLQGHGTAVIHDIAIAGNLGHMGTGKQVNVIPGNGTTTGGVDTTTLTSTNTQ